jgi:hypothetical protein
MKEEDSEKDSTGIKRKLDYCKMLNYQAVGADLVSARIDNSIILLYPGGHEVLPYRLEVKITESLQNVDI